MLIALPDIIRRPEYAGTWERDGWKLKAKPDAPEAVKKAIAEWEAEVANVEAQLARDVEQNR